MALELASSVAPDIKSIIVKDMLEEVGVATNAFLQMGDNWFTQNGKTLNVLVGNNAYIIDFLQKNPDKIPSIVAIEPFVELVGSGSIKVTIPKIVIVTNYDSQNNLTDRYETTIKPVLYPAYECFLEQLAEYPNVEEADWLKFSQTRSVVPGWQPADKQLELFLDAIQLTNLQITIFSPFK